MNRTLGYWLMSQRWLMGRLGLAALIWLSVVAAGAQTPATALAQAQQLAPSNPPTHTTAAVPPAKPPTATKTLAVSKPEWKDLNPSQQLALQPLAAKWNGINEGQKRKWLAVSQNFNALPAAEQGRLHERMTSWVALSPQERSQARLNFAGARDLPPDERMAKWQAYQALSPEERQELAAQAPLKPPGAAIAIRPSAAQKLVVTPTLGKSLEPRDPKNARPAPRIATAPHEVDHNTLLPQPAPASDPAESP